MQTLPAALAPMGAYNQFILYKLINRGDRTDKLPVDYRTLQVFKEGDNWQQDPNAWTDATTAINTAKLCGSEYGVGFFFTANDPFWFLDIDKCVTPENQWNDIANTLMGMFSNAAIEVSQSGRGLHIFGSGVVPEHGCKNKALGLELYTEGRFVALTGTNAQGNASTDYSGVMTTLVDTYFPPVVALHDDAWTTTPRPEYTPLKDDVTLIKKMLATKSTAAQFNKKASFKDLWERNVGVLADLYAPDDSDDELFDESSVDAALAQHLAFWTGCNCDHILALMWCSGLVRDKWTTHKTYLTRTITRAVSLQKIIYTSGERARVSVEPVGPLSVSNEPEVLTGYQFLAADQQIEHFKGCTYIQDVHKIFTPNGSLLKQEQFNATYGGYVFKLDDANSGKVTRKAWEAFVESQAVRYPKAETSCFRPELPQGTIVKEEGRLLVNTYVPINTPRMKGDATPFLKHLKLLLPVEKDRDILLAYMAACIQYKGVKFQWAPLLQGVEGNGKTLFTRCVAFAVGNRYTFIPMTNEIAEKYNEWLFYKLFIGIEDVYVPEHKKEVIEIIKPMITNDRLAMRAMQCGQIMGDNRANFILNSNHKDAIRKTRNDRRFSVFFTAQQTNDDLERDGMMGSYFPDLYKWLRGDGYAIVAEFLATYVIPEELNPATTCNRAPDTSSTDEAVAASLGGIEQEVIEAVEEGRVGFAGGWVSSMAFEKLLDDLHATRHIPHNKRRVLLQSLGYDWHPALRDGRVNNAIFIDGGKPRLFIKAGHIHANLTTPAEVAKAYQEAQGDHRTTPTETTHQNKSN